MDQNSAEHIAALIERIGRLLTVEAHAHGLLPVQWEALRYVHRANRFSRTAAALTAYLGITKGTVSQTLKALQAKGLISKKTNAADRRINQLMLTPRGEALLQHDPLQQTVEALQHQDAALQSGLAVGLESLLRARLQAQQRRPFGQCRDCRYFAVDHAEGSPHFCQLLGEPLAAADAVAICHEQQPLRKVRP